MTARLPSKRGLARHRQLNALLRQGRQSEAAALEASWASAPAPSFTPKVQQPAAYVERDEQGVVTAVTPAGLALVESLSKHGAPQSKIAAKLGLLLKAFKSLLATNRGENELRLAYERGAAEFEHDIVKRLLKHGKISFVPLIFLAKARLGWSETGPAAMQIQNNVILTLPKARTREQYFSMLGVADPKAIAGTATMKTVEALPAPSPESETGADAPTQEKEYEPC